MVWIFTIVVLPYLLILLFIRRHLPGIDKTRHELVPDTKVSVVVACRNEEKSLPLLLDALSHQQYPADLFEVIIVDDNSYDNTSGIAAAFRQIKNLQTIKNEGNGKKSALRTGILASDGDLILTTDADCIMGNRWIGSMVSFYREKKADMIIGPVILENKPGFFQGFQQLEFLSLQGVTAGSASSGNPVMCNGANLAFTKEAYLKHSGKLYWDIPSGDDIFLLHSLKEAKGNRIMWIDRKDAVVTTAPADSLISFLRQRARWLSKAGSYRDRFTQAVAIVTFVTISGLLIFPVPGIFYPSFFAVYGVVFLLKSIPDFLILQKVTSLNKNQILLKWFIPAQIIYPFYVGIVTVYSFWGANKWR